MEIKAHKLFDDDGNAVRFEQTANVGGNLKGSKPKFCVIHYTAGATANGAIRTFKRTTPPRVSAHFVVDHDGSITQMIPCNKIGWHAGKSRWKNIDGLNSHSVGIEIANWGLLTRGQSRWSSWTGAPIPDDRVIVAEHKNSPGRERGWEIFDPAQFEACIGITRAIVERYDLEPWDVVGHDDISPLRKVDPGPAFDMDRFRAHVFGREIDTWNTDVFVVRSPSGLNMRTMPSVGGSLIKNLPDGTSVHVIERQGSWWLVAEIVDGDDDVTGFVHRNWLTPE